MKREWHHIDFKAEVVEYIESLNDFEKQEFEKVFDELINYGRDLKWIYFALRTLGNRSVISCKRLFYNKSFCAEVHDLAFAYDLDRDREVKTLINKDKAEWKYNCIAIPAYFNKQREYSPSSRLMTKLQKYYGDEALPSEILELLQPAQCT